MSKQLLITFTPADYYFFGGENTFDAETTGVRNYLVRSNKLPQQTALVGVLRYILLKNNHNIGQGSFDADWKQGKPQQFGGLIDISPLFLQFGEGESQQFYWPASKLWLEKSIAEMSVDFSASPGKGITDTQLDAVPLLEWTDNEGKKHTYNGKEQAGDFWLSTDGKDRKSSGDIFKSALHIGIDKASRMRDEGDDEAFYKQEFFQMAKGFSFAVIATVDKNIPDDTFNTVMQIGGEQRSFTVQAVAFTESVAKKTDNKSLYAASKDERVVLLSDAWVENSAALMQYCRFAVTGTKPFRNIRTSLQPSAKELANLHHGKAPLVRNLLERGSVLFPLPGKSAEVCQLLDHSNFKVIGYNHYHQTI